MTLRLASIILTLTILALLTGCQTQEAVGTPPARAAALQPATRTPTHPMPIDRPTATPLPAVEPTAGRPSPQATALPTKAVDQIPTACEAAYCLYPAEYPFQPPVEPVGPAWIDLTYPFGETQDGAREVHLGVEMQQAHGAPVMAAAPGRVVVAGDDRQTAYGVRKRVYGNLVVIEHELDGWEEPVYTLYAHLSDVLVAVGEWVETGTVIGRVGATGAATGSHLHFEVRVGRNEPAAVQNPLLFLRPPGGREDTGRIVGVILDNGGPAAEQNLVLQFVPLEPDAASRSTYLETYAKGVSSGSHWQENFVSGDLPAGEYRLTLIHEGRLIERLLPVEPGSVTYLKIQLGE